MSVKGDTEPNIWIISFQCLRVAKNAIPFLSILPQIKTFEGLYEKLLGLKLVENWIFVFQPVGRVKSGRSSWDLFILWVHDEFMQVFNGKNTDWISKSLWCTLEFGYKLVHCLRFNTRQGFKGAEFLKSPKNLIFRRICLQDSPRYGNLSEASECFA